MTSLIYIVPFTESGYSFLVHGFNFWIVTGLPIFRPLPVLLKLNTENALLD